jgi:uncharacterized protein (DUF952 family)
MSTHPALSVLEADALHTMLSRIKNHDWDGAHEIAQSQEGVWAYDRLHAYLHRLEGDAANTAYWYRRCGLSQSNVSEKEEWDFLSKWVEPYRLVEQVLFHVVEQSDWEAQQNILDYEAASLSAEGFIHLSLKSQVSGVLERYYAGRNDLLLLHLDPKPIVSHLKFEKGPTGDYFPHLFSKLPKSAIIRVEQIIQEA